MHKTASMREFAIFLTLSSLLLPAAGWASSPQAVPDLQSSVKEGLFEATPPAGHHFNVKAPAEIKEGQASLKFDLAAQKLAVRLPPNGSEQDLAVEVFVCDDANTFCRKKSQHFRIPPVTATAVRSATQSLLASTAKPAKAHFEKDTDFFVNDPEKAFAAAARKKLPLMIDFFGIWCPPCNHLDAMIFRSHEFKAKTASHFVKLKIDTDQDRFNELKNRYKIQGLPTVVFATSSGDEIFRLLGFHPLDEMMAKSDAAYSSRDEGYAALEAKASGADKDKAQDARYKAARIALDRDEPAKALEWLLPMKEKLTTAHDERLADFYRAQLGAAQAASDKKLARETLENWLKDFPDSSDSIENFSSLSELQADAGDQAGQKASLTRAVALTEKLLASSPAALQGSYYTPADLAEERADLIDKLGDKARAKEAYLACAEAYQKEALAEGTAFPRGPNLERGYCLGKAGEFKQSEALYREGIRRFPGEYTFYQGLARLWLESAKEPAKALPEAQKAVSVAYGNQRLKALMVMARTLESLQQPEKAVQAIDAELAQPAPEGATPGTVKLREKLKAKADELRKKSGAKAQSA